MDYYVKALANSTAILMAEDGHPLASFGSVEVAVKQCLEACLVEPLFVEQHYSYLQCGPGDFESSYVQIEH